MNQLLIETSGRRGLVGLARDGAVVQSATLDESRRHAADLAVKTRQLLEAEKLQPAQIRRVVVSLGPGSYTSLRVGLASAKAFAYATGCELVAVPTFAAIVENLPADCAGVHVLADALQGQVYIETYQPTDGIWRSVEPLRIVPAGQLSLKNPLTGPGVAIHEASLPPGIERVAESLRQPTLEGLLRAGRNLPALSREELFRIEPLYLRGSSAEEKAQSMRKAAKASSRES